MLAIAPPTKRRKLTPNILPCTIAHSGPIPVSKRYWDPTPSTTASTNTTLSSTAATSTAYLRGRKLWGRTVKLPAAYTGHLLQKTDKLLAQTPAREEPRPLDLRLGEDAVGQEVEVEEGEEEEETVKLMEQVGSFEEFVVWGHDAVPDEGDEYVKGIEEWIAFAEAMHTDYLPQRAKPMDDLPETAPGSAQ